MMMTTTMMMMMMTTTMMMTIMMMMVVVMPMMMTMTMMMLTTTMMMLMTTTMMMMTMMITTEAIAQSARRITGSIEMGTQAHFYMETQTSHCAPNDDGGLNVQTTTQWIDASAEVIAGILNIPQSA